MWPPAFCTVTTGLSAVAKCLSTRWDWAPAEVTSSSVANVVPATEKQDTEVAEAFIFPPECYGPLPWLAGQPSAGTRHTSNHGQPDRWAARERIFHTVRS